MQTTSTCLKIAALLALTASAKLPAAAQAPSSGPASTVVYAGGNDLVIKSAEGKLLNYTVPAGAKFTAGGKQVGISDLKTGTKLTAPVAGTPQVVTAVSVVKGKVYSVTPPAGVTLSLPEGVKDLMVPAGTTFEVDGKKLTLADLKAEMPVEATILTTAAEGTSVATPPAQAGALLITKADGEGDLPAAGTLLPLFALTGLALLTAGFALIGVGKPFRQK